MDTHLALYVCFVQNDYLPPEWHPLLQVIVGRIGNEDEENSILFELLSSVVGAASENIADHIPYIVSSLVGAISKGMHPSSEPWPQVGSFLCLGWCFSYP